MPAVVAKSKKKPDVNAAVSENIHNLAHSGKNHNKRVKAQGKAGAHKQEVAIAFKEAKGENKHFQKARKDSSRRKRNAGRS